MEQYLTFAISRDGRLVHIDEVDEVGIACGCTCPNPECSARLVAKNRKFPERQKCFHFAHEAGADCGKARESALHLLAKQILFEERKLAVPSIQGLPGPLNSVLVYEGGNLDFDEVVLEVPTGEFRPDAIGRIGLEEYFVEILVTHEVDEKKAHAARDMHWRLIEVDLARFLTESFTKESVRDFLIGGAADRRWITHPAHSADSSFRAVIPKISEVQVCPGGAPAKARCCKGCPSWFQLKGSSYGCYLAADFKDVELPQSVIEILKQRQAELRLPATEHTQRIFEYDVRNIINRANHALNSPRKADVRSVGRGAFVARCWRCLSDQVFYTLPRLDERRGRCRRCGATWSPKEGGPIQWLRDQETPVDLGEHECPAAPDNQPPVDRSWAIWAELPGGGERWTVARDFTESEAETAVRLVRQNVREQGWLHEFGVRRCWPTAVT